MKFHQNDTNRMEKHELYGNLKVLRKMLLSCVHTERSKFLIWQDMGMELIGQHPFAAKINMFLCNKLQFKFNI